ncbi:unnamed protein product [Allacma fusca]|uniref:Uncharacterized protein n=1 Tax=Allacma fusca TaxID=39272 RepID=A0A8J2JRI2_9HEXA|nr:unnamed protein product [Allacma fusca]
MEVTELKGASCGDAAWKSKFIMSNSSWFLRIFSSPHSPPSLLSIIQFPLLRRFLWLSLRAVLDPLVVFFSGLIISQYRHSHGCPLCSKMRPTRALNSLVSMASSHESPTPRITRETYFYFSSSLPVGPITGTL